jgi:hypothetical protein
MENRTYKVYIGSSLHNPVWVKQAKGTDVYYLIVGPSGKTMFVNPDLSYKVEVRNFSCQSSTYSSLDAAIHPEHRKYITEADTFWKAYNSVRLLHLVG